MGKGFFQLVDLKGDREALTLADIPLASGADGGVYVINSHEDMVAKLYHQPLKYPTRLQKIQAMLVSPPDLPAIVLNNFSYVQIAWPTGWIVDKKKTLLGYVMPKVNLKRATALENLLSKKSREIIGIPEGYGYRVTAALNLTALVTALHARGHYIIDLKPINLNVYTDTFYISILDCDGFSIQGNNGERYPAHQFSDGYIAPEVLRGRQRPEELAEDQDRFALAVILFQLLNQGIHPYQGVPVKGTKVPTTNAERIERELYAYGSIENKLLKPSPWSIHKYFEDTTQGLFDRAFTTKINRPSAQEWRDHLLYFADKSTGALKVCATDNDHGYFSKGCGFCAVSRVVSRVKQNNSKPAGKKRKQKKRQRQAASILPNPSHSTPHVATQAPLSLSEKGWFFLGLVGWFIILFIFFSLIAMVMFIDLPGLLFMIILLLLVVACFVCYSALVALVYMLHTKLTNMGSNQRGKKYIFLSNAKNWILGVPVIMLLLLGGWLGLYLHEKADDIRMKNGKNWRGENRPYYNDKYQYRRY